MLTIHLSCPRCSRNLRCHRLIAPGERLRCPHCGGVFRAGIDDAPQSVSESSQALPSRGRGILLAWLLFANVLVLAGSGIGIAVALGNRDKPHLSEFVGVDESPRPTTQQLAEVGDLPHSTTLPTGVTAPPAAQPNKPSPTPVPPRDPPPAPPKPPPLPQPQRRKPEQKTPPKDKLPDPEKQRSPAPDRHEAQQAHWLPPLIQKQVDRSIDNGIEFLRRRQRSDGSWGNQIGLTGKRFTPGITALSALTLLECGVPARDAQVRSAALYLRQRMPELTATYSISLAILFFDRLGDESDAARIRTLALRLIAGQKPTGGWDYYCPTLNDDEELGLLALLYKDRPTTPVDLFVAQRGKDLAQESDPKRDSELYRPRPSKVPPLELFVGQERSSSSPVPQSPKANESSAERKTEKRERKAETTERLPGDSRRLSKRALEAADKLPEELRRTPALRSAELLREPPDLDEPRTDNSNTQFAILGLLTAENYDVPMERAMALLDSRFRNSMTVLGGWNYRPNLNLPTTPSMTAAALMGLALKHGLLLPNRSGRGRDVVVHDDEIIHRGFLTLAGMLEGYYAGFVFNPGQLTHLDLYCLWTVERVAVLYNQRTLGDLEWYPAGVQLLLPLQSDNGSWSSKGTNCLEEPSVSSSFALLFLRRSNLARGLTERLIAPSEK